ncbi:MAG: long-chain fatty acid--CoA ligase [Gammaproteobacteria bacterium]|nr:long-chain fatty acid--CoA ligase [Gammaproteobacteria bacterium]|tara:strand:- start:1607 stop:3397 length:1791 start_codon:yes stop_codon:yes gene_type:complete
MSETDRADGYGNLAELWQRSSEAYSERQLFGVKEPDGWRWMTYGDLAGDVDACRAALAGHGIGAGGVVAVVADNRPEWAAAAYATYGRRACYVPMYQAQGVKEWRFILNDCSAQLVFCASAEIFESLRGLAGQVDGCPALEHVVCFDLPSDHPQSWQSFLSSAGTPVAPEFPAPEELAGFIYTSGTTGDPKGVKLSHGNIVSNINAVQPLLPLSGDDRSLSFLPWAHSFGQTCELHLLASLGVAMGLNDEVPNLVENLPHVQPTVLLAVPRIFNRIYDAVTAQIRERPQVVQNLVNRGIAAAERQVSGDPLSLGDRLAFAISDKLVFNKVRARFGGRLRYALSGSAALSPEVASFIDALGIMVYEGYGLSETSPIVSTNYPGHRKLGSVGKPIPGVTVEIDAAATEALDQGEIIVRGPNVMQGYHNRPEEQANVFTDRGGLRTGDTGWLDDDGYLYIGGRIKEQYKLENGRYVMPAPLEERLKLSPYIAHVMLEGTNRPFNMVLVVPAEEALAEWAQDHGRELGRASESPDVHSLISSEVERLAADFKGFEKPKAVVVVDEEFTTDNGLLTPTLKIKRAKVMEKYQAEIDAAFAAV